MVQSNENMVEELGYVALDPASGKYVLWLKDIYQLFTGGGKYIRGVEFGSMREAKREAAGSTVAILFHMMWLKKNTILPVSIPEARTVIINTVENMQINQNSLGVQITNVEVDRIKDGVEKATPSLLAKIFKEWIPKTFSVESIKALLKLLSVG